MAILTPKRRAVLQEMVKGKVIKEYTGEGRPGAYTYLVDPPWRAPGHAKMQPGIMRQQVNYSDFEALAFDLRYIIQYHTEYPDVYYKITPAGEAALIEGRD